MSATLEKQAMTPTQRINEAVRVISEELGLDDTKALTAALIESAVEGVRRNTGFADHVRVLYQQMIAKPNTQRRRVSGAAATKVELHPIKNMERHEVVPGAAPDPYFLLELYGSEQLTDALSRYKASELRLSAQLVQERNTDAKKLANKATKPAIIEYIVRYVARDGAAS